MYIHPLFADGELIFERNGTVVRGLSIFTPLARIARANDPWGQFGCLSLKIFNVVFSLYIVMYTPSAVYFESTYGTLKR